jgi:hypothetical protein
MMRNYSVKKVVSQKRYVMINTKHGRVCALDKPARASMKKNTKPIPDAAFWVDMLPSADMKKLNWPCKYPSMSPFYTPFPFAFLTKSAWHPSDFPPVQTPVAHCSEQLCHKEGPYFVEPHGLTLVCWFHLYEVIIGAVPEVGCTCSTVVRIVWRQGHCFKCEHDRAWVMSGSSGIGIPQIVPEEEVDPAEEQPQTPPGSPSEVPITFKSVCVPTPYCEVKGCKNPPPYGPDSCEALVCDFHRRNEVLYLHQSFDSSIPTPWSVKKNPPRSKAKSHVCCFNSVYWCLMFKLPRNKSNMKIKCPIYY